MAGLSLYDPRKQVFRTYVPPTEGDLPREELLLWNILIELKVLTHFMQAATPGSEEVNNIRADTVAQM